jgi:hypothetical protein
MNRIIGDRTKKSALDEMEEVARVRNRDVAEEERLDAIRKAKGEQNPNASAEKPQDPIILPATYKDIEIEPKAARTLAQSREIKHPMLYNVSLKRLKKAGYERHASPSEALSLIYDGVEGKLSGILETIYNDVMWNCGEWLSMAFERQGDLLICYLHPENLPERGLADDSNGFGYADKREFNIKGLESGAMIRIREMEDFFIRTVYGREYRDLPDIVKNGSALIDAAHIMLPPDRCLLPVYRPMENHLRFCVKCLSNMYNGSRGTRMSAEKRREEENKLRDIENFGWSGTDEDGFYVEEPKKW